MLTPGSVDTSLSTSPMLAPVVSQKCTGLPTAQWEQEVGEFFQPKLVSIVPSMFQHQYLSTSGTGIISST